MSCKRENRRQTDSITFISDVPKHLHVEVKDKGSNLMRTAWLKTPTLILSFRDLAENGYMICSKSDIMVGLKEAFGAGSTILSTSIDSLRLTYTDRPANRCLCKYL